MTAGPKKRSKKFLKMVENIRKERSVPDGNHGLFIGDPDFEFPHEHEELEKAADCVLAKLEAFKSSCSDCAALKFEMDARNREEMERRSYDPRPGLMDDLEHWAGVFSGSTLFKKIFQARLPRDISSMVIFTGGQGHVSGSEKSAACRSWVFFDDKGLLWYGWKSDVEDYCQGIRICKENVLFFDADYLAALAMHIEEDKAYLSMEKFLGLLSLQIDLAQEKDRDPPVLRMGGFRIAGERKVNRKGA